MSIFDKDKIDIYAINNSHIELIIADYLEWDKQTEDEHLLLLQEKLNVYIAFYESGEIYETIPESKNKNVVINIVGKYPLNKKGEWFLDEAKKIVEKVGVSLKFECDNL